MKAGGKGDDRGLDGWMASPTQWTWVWASSRRWWRTGKPGVLQSVGLQRVRHNWVAEQQYIIHKYKYFLHYILLKCVYYNAHGMTCYLLIYWMVFPWWLGGKESTCQCKRCRFNPWVRKIPWRKKWQPTPVFLPGKSHGQRSLAGYSPWGCKESDMTYQLKNSNNLLYIIDQPS